MFRNVVLALVLTGCAAPLSSNLPLGNAFPPEPDLTLAWVGSGEGWRYADEAWTRDPTQDYTFSVVQRRYATRWVSEKSVHRFHVDYDGSAGARDAMWSFVISYAPGADSELDVGILSSLGAGTGHADKAFEEAELNIEAEVSSLAPFSHYKITQRYDYAAGQLHETVLLYKAGGEDTPFFRSEERATLLSPATFTTPPTQWADVGQ